MTLLSFKKFINESITFPYEELVKAGAPREHILKQVQKHISDIDKLGPHVKDAEKNKAKAELTTFMKKHLLENSNYTT